jgi:hypothetical protein
MKAQKLMLLTVQNIRHIVSEEHESIAMELIYFELPVEKNEKSENAHCCCKRINKHRAKKKTMVSST